MVLNKCVEWTGRQMGLAFLRMTYVNTPWLHCYLWCSQRVMLVVLCFFIKCTSISVTENCVFESMQLQMHILYSTYTWNKWCGCLVESTWKRRNMGPTVVSLRVCCLCHVPLLVPQSLFRASSFLLCLCESSPLLGLLSTMPRVWAKYPSNLLAGNTISRAVNRLKYLIAINHVHCDLF